MQEPDNNLIQLPNVGSKPKSESDQVRDDLGDHDAAIALAICEELACETKGLHEIAGKLCGKEGPAAARMFYRWRVRSGALARIYARAMEGRTHVIAHSLIEVIDSERDHPHKARVKLDALRWLCAKFNRAQFGDHSQRTAVQVNVNTHDDGRASLEEIRKRVARKRAALERSRSVEDATAVPRKRGDSQ